jgi:PAS domain S-box-containing protein
MDVDRKALSHIREILKAHPRGMNVSEVAREIGMNRQSVAKYLEMMAMSGHVDVRTFGPSKVYYLSQRLPISAMLSLSYDFIILLDRQLNVLNVNDRFIEFSGVSRDDILYRSVDHLAFPLQFEPSIMPNIKEALKGEESAIEAYYKKNGRGSYFNIKFIPMVLDDGEKGITVIFEDITEKKRIEDAITESEEKFRSVIEQSSDGMMLSDENGIVIEYNGAMERVTGVGRQEVLGRPLWEAHHIILGRDPELGKRLHDLRNRIRSYLKNGASNSLDRIVEIDIHAPDKTLKTIQFNHFNIKTKKGIIACSCIRDVTELKKAERALKDSEERYRILAETAEDYIYVIDRDLKVQYLNESGVRSIGIPPEGVIGRNLGVLFPALTYAQMRRDLLRIFETGESMQTEIAVPQKGEKTWTSVKLTPIKEGDTVTSVVGISRDITHRKRMEDELREAHDDLDRKVRERTSELEAANEALRKSEEKYRSLVENVSDIVWEMDGSFRFNYVSPRVRDLLGLEPESALGKTPYDLMPPDEAARVKKMQLPVGMAKEPFALLECEFLHADGHRVLIEISGDPILDEHGELRGYRGVTRNINLRKKP